MISLRCYSCVMAYRPRSHHDGIGMLIPDIMPIGLRASYLRVLEAASRPFYKYD